MDIIVPGNNIEPRVPSCSCYCETNYTGGGCPSLCHNHPCGINICVPNSGDWFLGHIMTNICFSMSRNKL